MFGLGNALRIRAYIPASGVFVESISRAAMGDIFGIVELLGKLGEKMGENRKQGQHESWKPCGSGIV